MSLLNEVVTLDSVRNWDGEYLKLCFLYFCPQNWPFKSDFYIA
jgi:hypothetical protein